MNRRTFLGKGSLLGGLASLLGVPTLVSAKTEEVKVPYRTLIPFKIKGNGLTLEKKIKEGTEQVFVNGLLMTADQDYTHTQDGIAFVAGHYLVEISEGSNINVYGIVA